MKWLTKQHSWLLRLTIIFALVTMLFGASRPSFAEAELHSQGSAGFFGKYEEPNPAPTPDPKPEPEAVTQQASGKDVPSQFPKTGSVIRNLTLPGILLVGIAFFLFILKNRKKKEF